MGAAELVAVTVTVCCVAIEAGAVYRPVAETVPTAGLTVHVTAVFELPVTVAVSCCVWLAISVAVSGLMVTATGGFRVIVAVAL